MTTAVKISEELFNDARLYSKIDNRSITDQIEYWAKIGKIAEHNQDLTYKLIKDILIGIEQLNQNQKTEYKFG